MKTLQHYALFSVRVLLSVHVFSVCRGYRSRDTLECGPGPDKSQIARTQGRDLSCLKLINGGIFGDRRATGEMDTHCYLVCLECRYRPCVEFS